MKTFFYFLIATVFISLSISCTTGNDQSQEAATPLSEFSDMKFGMFIHWGLYAIPGGEWKGEDIKGIGEWIMKRAEIPAQEYAQLANEFNPVKYNAEEWVRLAVDAGMKYLVITSKHHDGFAMFDTDASEFDIVDATPYKKDPMVSLASECEKMGIKFGFYYSQAQDWYEPNAAGNTWDFPEDRNPEIYLQKKVYPQVDEILHNYGPLALIWFDTPQLLNKEQVTKLYKNVKQVQPNCLVNSRIGYGLGDYDQLGDNQVPVEVRVAGKKWEVPATLNDTWGFKYKDKNWKNPEELIFKLCDVISKGGNYLLNVGPDAEGVIPSESQDILRTMGKWVSANQEGIYGTGHSPFFPVGVDWRCTTKPKTLYFHIFNKADKIQIDGLVSKLKSAELLSTGEKVEFEQKGHSLIFNLGTIENPVPVIKVKISDESAVIAPGYAWNDPQTDIEFPSRIARFFYEDITYNREEKTATGFKPTGVSSPNNALWWNYRASEEGEYRVFVEYFSDSESAGGTMIFDLEAYEGNVEIDDHYKYLNKHMEHPVADGQNKLQIQEIGTIKLVPGVNFRYKLKMDESGTSANVRIKGLILKKV